MQLTNFGLMTDWDFQFENKEEVISWTKTKIHFPPLLKYLTFLFGSRNGKDERKIVIPNNLPTHIVCEFVFHNFF